MVLDQLVEPLLVGSYSPSCELFIDSRIASVHSCWLLARSPLFSQMRCSLPTAHLTLTITASLHFYHSSFTKHAHCSQQHRKQRLHRTPGGDLIWHRL